MILKEIHGTYTYVMNSMCLNVFIFVFKFKRGGWGVKFNLKIDNEALLNTLIVITLSYKNEIITFNKSISLKFDLIFMMCNKYH